MKYLTPLSRPHLICFFLYSLLLCLFCLFSTPLVADKMSTVTNANTINSKIESIQIIKTKLEEIQTILKLPTLTDESLIKLRQKVRENQKTLANISHFFNARMQRLNNTIQQFDPSSNSSSNPIIQKAYTLQQNQNGYLKKLALAKQKINTDKGILFDIAFIQNDLKTALNDISNRRILIRNQDIFLHNNPIYNLHTWRAGWQDFHIFTQTFWKNVPSIELFNITLWFRLFLSGFLILYLSFIRRWNQRCIQYIECRLTQYPNIKSQAFIAPIILILKGIIPALLIECITRDTNATGMWVEFTNNLSYSLGLWFLLYATFSLQNTLFSNAKLRHAYILLSTSVSLLFFINNLNFFSLTTYIVPVLPEDSAALLDFIIGLSSLFFSFQLYKQLSQQINFKNSATKQLKFLTIDVTNIHKLFLIIPLFFCFYIFMTLIGLSNLSSGILLNLLQCFLIIYYTYLTVQLLCQSTTFVVQFFQFSNAKKSSFLLYWIHSIIILILAFICLSALFLVVGVQPERLYDWLELLFIDGFPIGHNTNFSLFYLFKAVFVLLVFYYLSKLIQKIVDRKVLPYTSIDIGTRHAIHTTIGYAGLILSITMFVYALGVNSTTLTFILSGLSVGVGFALKDLFNNFFCGFILLIERPIKIGDLVNVDSEIGTVKKIRIRATVIETFNKNTLIIPNSFFVTSVVSNETLNPISRLSIDIGVAYGTDPTLVIETLLETARNLPIIHSEPEPSVLFTEFADSSLNFKLRAYVEKINQVNAESALRVAICKAFEEKGIAIPFPQRDIHIKHENGVN